MDEHRTPKNRNARCAFADLGEGNDQKYFRKILTGSAVSGQTSVSQCFERKVSKPLFSSNKYSEICLEMNSPSRRGNMVGTGSGNQK